MPHGWRPRPVRAIADRLRAGAGRLHFVDRRKAGRLKRAAIGCNIGMIVDISDGGMRVRSRRRYQGALDIQLTTRTDVVKVTAKVVWTRKLAFRRHEIGLQFLGLTPDLSARLATIGVAFRG